MSDTRDHDLSQRYRTASTEVPPPELGEALRAAAARSAAAAPAARRRKWGAPLALAASVVLGLGMVLRVAVERPDMRPVVEAPAPAAQPAPGPVADAPRASPPAAAPESADASPPPAAEPDAAQLRAMRKAELPMQSAPGARDAGVASVGESKVAAAAPAPAPVPATTSPPEAIEPLRAAKEVGSAQGPVLQAQRQAEAPRSNAPAVVADPPAAAAQPATRAASGAFVSPPPPPPPFPSPAAKPAPAMPEAAVAAAPPRPPAPAAAPPPAPPRIVTSGPETEGSVAAMRGATTGPAAPAPAPAAKPAARNESAALADARRSREDALAEVVSQRALEEERALSPADWLKRIVELRRAGRIAEAEASLKRFIERHPDVRVPVEARAP